MTHEEMERTIQFLLDQTAKLTTDLEWVTSSHASLLHNVDRLATVVSKLANAVEKVIDIQEKVAVREAARPVQQAEQQRQVDEKLEDLSQRVDIFITTVERYISEKQHRRRISKKLPSDGE